MDSIHNCINDLPLIIAGKENIFKELEKAGVTPTTALITAWSNPRPSREVELMVEHLIRSGCTFLVCAGEYAEALHDYADDIIFSLGAEGKVVTTHHEDESPEDVANFFANATFVARQERSGLAAVLEDFPLGDKLIKESLLRM